MFLNASKGTLSGFLLLLLLPSCTGDRIPNTIAASAPVYLSPSPQSPETSGRPARLAHAHSLRFFRLYPYVQLKSSQGQTLNFLLDTGANGSFLAADALESAGKATKLRRAVATFEWGKADCEIVTISSLSWDDEECTDIRVAVVERRQHRFLELSGLDGILGYTFLEGKSLTIDYWRMEVELRNSGLEAGLEGEGIPFTLNDQEIIVAGEAAGKSGSFLVDTGTDLLLLDREFCVQEGLLPKDLAPSSGGGSDVRVPHFRVGMFEERQIPAFAKKLPTVRSGIIGIIGNQLLGRAGRITIDYPRKRLYLKCRNRAAVEEMLRENARGGEGWAQYSLYEAGRGKGDEGPSPEALDWLRKAAAGGHSEAQFALGEKYYLKNSAIPQDFEAARTWFERSSAQGHPDACWYLGRMHLRGEAVSHDPSKGIKFLLKGALGGSLEAQADLGRELVFGDARIRDEAKGFTWLLRAAQRGNLVAQHHVGICFQKGLGVVKNPDDAWTWYLRSAKAGTPAAMFALGDFFRNGVNGTVDLAAAKHWYQKASDLGHPGAKEALLDLKGSK